MKTDGFALSFAWGRVGIAVVAGIAWFLNIWQGIDISMGEQQEWVQQIQDMIDQFGLLYIAVMAARSKAMDKYREAKTIPTGEGFIRLPVLLLLLALSVGSFGFFGCKGLMGGVQDVKSWADMTPTEKAIFCMDIYNKQYDDYMFMTGYEKRIAPDGVVNFVKVRNPELTEAQKEVLRIKREVLVQFEPLAKTYRLVVGAGGAPNAETEEQLYRLLNQLGVQLERGL